MTIQIDEPTDFLGNIFAKIIASYLNKTASPPMIETWKMRIVLVTDLYPISMLFENGLKIQRGEIENATLRLTSTMTTIVQIAKGDVSMIGAVLRRKIKIRGLIRHPIAALRFYRLINKAIGGG